MIRGEWEGKKEARCKAGLVLSTAGHRLCISQPSTTYTAAHVSDLRAAGGAAAASG